MDTAAEMAKGHLDGDTTWMLFDMLQNRYDNVISLIENWSHRQVWRPLMFAGWALVTVLVTVAGRLSMNVFRDPKLRPDVGGW